jgi:hypothetical protein
MPAANVSKVNLYAATSPPVGASVSKLVVYGVLAPMGLAPCLPPTGIVGTAYTFTVRVLGGVAPYTFSISAGALPAGLTIAAATGVISGVPILSSASIPFTVQVVDSLGAVASIACSITIYGTVVITLHGWKLYQDQPCEDAIPGIELPPVDRAV